MFSSASTIFAVQSFITFVKLFTWKFITHNFQISSSLWDINDIYKFTAILDQRIHHFYALKFTFATTITDGNSLFFDIGFFITTYAEYSLKISHLIGQKKRGKNLLETLIGLSIIFLNEIILQSPLKQSIEFFIVKCIKSI